MVGIPPAITSHAQKLDNNHRLTCIFCIYDPKFIEGVNTRDPRFPTWRMCGWVHSNGLTKWHVRKILLASMRDINKLHNVMTNGQI